MSLATIRSALKTVLQGVTGIGNVHDYMRNFAGDSRKFKDIFSFKTLTDTLEYHAWQITRVSTPETPHNQDQVNLRRHSIRIFGAMQVNDTNATEKTFQDLIEAICVALRLNSKQPSPYTALRTSPPQVGIVEHRMINNRLCHTVNITMWFEEYIQF